MKGSERDEKKREKRVEEKVQQTKNQKKRIIGTKTRKLLWNEIFT